jgi:hypothetical protein
MHRRGHGQIAESFSGEDRETWRAALTLQGRDAADHQPGEAKLPRTSHSALVSQSAADQDGAGELSPNVLPGEFVAWSGDHHQRA